MRVDSVCRRGFVSRILQQNSLLRIKNTHSLTHAAHPRSEEGEQERGRHLCDLICEQATAECTKIQPRIQTAIWVSVATESTIT